MFNIYVDSNAGVGNYQFKVEGRNIKLSTGNVYLMAIIDWFSRKVLSWRVFNTKNWTGRCFYNFIDLCLRNRDSYKTGHIGLVLLYIALNVFVGVGLTFIGQVIVGK